MDHIPRKSNFLYLCVMRKFGTSLFLILYGVALIRPIAPLIEYYAERDYFANVLCINKDKPELQCNGQCILMQKLRKASGETQEQPNAPAPSSGINLKDYPIGFVTSLQCSALAVCLTHEISFKGWVDNLPSSPLFEIFHPPKIS